MAVAEEAAGTRRAAGVLAPRRRLRPEVDVDPELSGRRGRGDAGERNRQQRGAERAMK